MAQSTKVRNIFFYGPVTLTKAEEVKNCWVHGEGRVFCNESTEGERSEEPKCSLFTSVKSKHPPNKDKLDLKQTWLEIDLTRDRLGMAWMD